MTSERVAQACCFRIVYNPSDGQYRHVLFVAAFKDAVDHFTPAALSVDMTLSSDDQ